MREYELMVVLDPNLDESAIEALNTRIQNMVTQRGGTLESVESWGRKRLAYPIGRYRDGAYILSRFQMPPNAAAEIERALKLKIARKQMNKSDRTLESRPVVNTLRSRTLSKMAGEVFS